MPPSAAPPRAAADGHALQRARPLVLAVLLLALLMLPVARAFAPIVAAPPVGSSSSSGSSSSRRRTAAGLPALPGSSKALLLAPLRAIAPSSGGMAPDDDPSPEDGGDDATAGAAGTATGASSDYNQQRGHQHQDDRLLHRRRPRVPFSQRRGSSWSGGGGGGGGNGEGGSSRRRGEDGGGERERDRENKGRVFRGVRTSFSEVDEAGRFVRSPSVFRQWVGPDEPKFKPQANRYHLYVSLACPWSAACLMAMYLKGLDNAISVSVAHPVWQRTKPNDEMDGHTGWVFRASKDPPLASPSGFGRFACDGCVQDYVNGARTVRELYEMSRDVNGKYTVPLLWDKRLGTIVNNESGDILRMLNAEFDALAMNPNLDLYPADLAAKLEETEGWLHDCVTDGVYRCGLARSQVAYDEAADALSQGLDHAEAVLSGQRYLLGDRLTGPDLRLFQALVRFDEVYHTLFRCNRKSVLKDYPNLLNYARDLYQLPGASLSVDTTHIRAHYYGSHPSLNPYGVVPTGPHLLHELYKPHDRDRFPRQSAGFW